jgi:hypothetical protein
MANLNGCPLKAVDRDTNRVFNIQPAISAAQTSTPAAAEWQF